jgi:hypothetical protein
MELKPNTRRRLAITVVIAAVICMSTQAGYAAASPVISVEPTYTGVSHGETFTVDITIDPCGDEVMGAQCELYFNNSLLRVLSQNKGSFLSQDGASVTVYTKEINNALGKIKYSAARTGVKYGVNTPGTLTTIMFEVIEDPEIGELRFGTVKLSHPNATYLTGVMITNGRVGTGKPSIPFVISGYVSHRDESVCNDPVVNITNLNMGREWSATTDESSNYYQIMLASPDDAIAGDVLRFEVVCGDGSNVTEHTVTQTEVDVGGFGYGIVLDVEAIPGDVNGDGEVTSADAVIALKMAVCGEYDLVADVNKDHVVTSLDALMIMRG